MIICRGFILFQWLVLCLIICFSGCDRAKEKPQDHSTQQSPEAPQTLTPKRAPQTLIAFQNAIETSQVGTISGRVLFKGDPPTPKELRVTLNKSTCGHTYQSESLLVSEKGGIQNAVVSLLKIPTGMAINSSESTLQMDQQKCVFIPHVLIVPANTEFSVLSSDPVLHNFHAIGKHNKEINVMQTKTRRRQLPVTFSEPDIIEVICDVHSWMKAWIIVAEHPYYTLTDEEGQFRLENVPEGSYRIKAWHEQLGEQIQEITAKVNQSTNTDFEFSQP
jgi:plastocyanin